MSENLSENSDQNLKRWRLILGGDHADGTGVGLQGADLGMDAALQALYGENDSAKQAGGLGASAPNVARWLGDIRAYFPASVVQVMQRDALERLGLQRMLLEPEMLAAVEPDIHLVSTLISLKNVIPARTKETARLVVRRVVEDLEKKLANPLRAAITGSLNRSVRNTRPRHNEIDWNRTIKLNLKHYQPEYKTIIAEKRIGYARKTARLRDIILCVDQSGSMAGSVVYSSIMAAVMASIKAVNTSLVVFDTAIVDLTEMLSDPIDVLFGTQLGGGTDINRALGYCQSLVRRPADTILVLISDLYEGGNQAEMLKRTAAIVRSGVSMIALLALDDRGAPFFDSHVAQKYAELNVPTFACTPDLFPALMAAAINRQDLSLWASSNGIVAGGRKP